MKIINSEVTDPVVLKELQRKGVNKSDVEFYKDYSAKFPYSKLYRNKKNNERIVSISNLPMVNVKGEKCVPEWTLTKGVYTSGANQFSAEVSGLTTTITCINDQPDGKKTGDKVTFTPKLYIDGVEVSPASETASIVDCPLNENYKSNVLEWDFGICKRILRLIEGRIHGYWVFTEKPKGTCRFEYNQSGDYRLKLGQFAISEDAEQVTPDDMDEFPFYVSDSATYYPDADPETSSYDGGLQDQNSSSGDTWASLTGGTGSACTHTLTHNYACFIRSGSDTDKWYILRRLIFLFDTSCLPDDAIISAATLSLYGIAKKDNLSITPNVNIYSTNPASNTKLSPHDYDSFGSTAFSTAITYSSWNTSGYNDFTLNSTGRAAISKTGVSKFGTRNASYDVADSAPSWSASVYSYLDTYMSEQGTGYKPKLVVTYTIPLSTPTVTTQACTNVSDTSATGNGNITDTGGVNCTVRGFCYKAGTSGDPTTADSEVHDTGDYGTGAFNKSITGLTAETGYRVRAYATNSKGTSYGSTVQLTTSAESPSSTSYNTRIGTKNSWTWDTCLYSSTDKCPHGTKNSWVWEAPASGGSDKTMQGSKNSFTWGDE